MREKPLVFSYMIDVAAQLKSFSILRAVLSDGRYFLLVDAEGFRLVWRSDARNGHGTASRSTRSDMAQP